MVDCGIPPRTYAIDSTTCYNQSLRLRLTACCADRFLAGPDAQPVGRYDSWWMLAFQPNGGGFSTMQDDFDLGDIVFAVEKGSGRRPYFVRSAGFSVQRIADVEDYNQSWTEYGLRKAGDNWRTKREPDITRKDSAVFADRDDALAEAERMNDIAINPYSRRPIGVK